MERKQKEINSKTDLGMRGEVWNVFYREPRRRGYCWRSGKMECLFRDVGDHHMEGSGKLRELGSRRSYLSQCLEAATHLAVLGQNPARGFPL